jgi:hypothetical protein
MCTTCFKNQKFYFWWGGFRMILRTNGHYFLKQNKAIDHCNGEVWCFI